MFTCSAMFLTVSQRFWCTIWRIFAMFSSVLLVAGRPDLSSSVTLSLPPEKRFTHLETAVFFIALSPQTCPKLSLISFPLFPSLTRSLMFAALIQAPTFSRRHTKIHADSNRCHSERDCHRSTTTTTTQLWNADMSTLSNHTKAFVQCCHGKHTVAGSRT